MLRVDEHLLFFADTPEALPERPARQACPALQRVQHLSTLCTVRRPVDSIELLIELAQLGDDVIDDRRPNRQVTKDPSDRFMHALDLLPETRTAPCRRPAVGRVLPAP